MMTPDPARLRCAALADQRQHQQWTFSAAELPRLAAAGRIRKPVAASVVFARDARGRIWAEGTVRAELAVPCHRCAESVDIAIDEAYRLCLVDENVAGANADADDLYVTSDGILNLLDLIEDEVLLALPARPCEALDCPNAPPMDYRDPQEQQAPAAKSAFAVLERLKKVE